jgi:2-keto-4-pentenoate hydratase/2-oxohepta-3-ene-1,7-dioic acid hydratase in catechol pathway
MTLWVRYQHNASHGFGTLEAETIAPHTGNLFDAPQPTGQTIPLAEARLLPPVRPGNFIGLWNNYHAQAAKQGNAIPATPLYFLKSPTSLLAPGGTIHPPRSYTGRTIYEGELGIVIGKTCRNATESEAESAIFGYTCVNDVTALDLLTEDASFPQWARAKSCDTFGPVGPAIATDLDWQTLQIRTLLNGRVRQDYPASDMILPPAKIIALLSRELTLRPGDLIAVGTSLGVLPMRPGMEVTVEITGIGTLTNTMGDPE